MAPKSSSIAPEMRTTAPTFSSRAGLEGFTVTVAYACWWGREGTRHICAARTPRSLRSVPGTSGGGWEGLAPSSFGFPLSPRSLSRVPGTQAWM